jgi:hypothetical protein
MKKKEQVVETKSVASLVVVYVVFCIPINNGI